LDIKRRFRRVQSVQHLPELLAGLRCGADRQVAAA
jgi:hypothetical protein